MTDASAPKLELPDYLQEKISEAFFEDLFKAYPQLTQLPKAEWKKIQPELGELYKVWWQHLWTSRENVPLLRQIIRYCLKERITVTPNAEGTSVTFKGELINGQFIEGTIERAARRRKGPATRPARVKADRSGGATPEAGYRGTRASSAFRTGGDYSLM